MKYTFSGPTEQVYPQYLDLDKGSTLHAQPGESYDIGPAEGHTVPTEPDDEGVTHHVPAELPMPPDDRWTKRRPPANQNQAVASGAGETNAEDS